MGTQKNQTGTHPSLVQHEKLTPYANFHTLPQIRRDFFFYPFKRLDYNQSREDVESQKLASQDPKVNSWKSVGNCRKC